MVAFRLLLCALVGLQSGLAPAAGDQAAALCAAELPAGVVRTHAQRAVPHVTYKRSAREIIDQAGTRQDAVALGLTVASVALDMDVVLHRAESKDGAVSCARPEIDIILSHSAMEIMLASEIEHDACVSALVLQHEMTHVTIERETLERAATSLSAQMQAYYREPIFFGDETQVIAALAREFDQRWAPVLDTLLKASNARRAEHDTRDSDKSACRGNLLRIARSIHY